MTTNTVKNMVHEEHAHHDHGAVTIFGFWVYILTDLMIFGCLFAVYASLDPAYGVAMYHPMMEVNGQQVLYDAKHIFQLPFVWMLVMIAQVAAKGLTAKVNTRLSCLSLFWHFLDIVWICVFTFVYLKAFAAF